MKMNFLETNPKRTFLVIVFVKMSQNSLKGARFATYSLELELSTRSTHDKKQVFCKS